MRPNSASQPLIAGAHALCAVVRLTLMLSNCNLVREDPQRKGNYHQANVKSLCCVRWDPVDNSTSPFIAVDQLVPLARACAVCSWNRSSLLITTTNCLVVRRLVQLRLCTVSFSPTLMLFLILLLVKLTSAVLSTSNIQRCDKSSSTKPAGMCSASVVGRPGLAQNMCASHSLHLRSLLSDLAARSKADARTRPHPPALSFFNHTPYVDCRIMCWPAFWLVRLSITHLSSARGRILYALGVVQQSLFCFLMTILRDSFHYRWQCSLLIA